eukprot:14856977-Heterocapsa_arctica.AAC.1
MQASSIVAGICKQHLCACAPEALSVSFLPSPGWGDDNDPWRCRPSAPEGRPQTLDPKPKALSPKP